MTGFFAGGEGRKELTVMPYWSEMDAIESVRAICTSVAVRQLTAIPTLHDGNELESVAHCMNDNLALLVCMVGSARELVEARTRARGRTVDAVASLGVKLVVVVDAFERWPGHLQVDRVLRWGGGVPLATTLAQGG